MSVSSYPEGKTTMLRANMELVLGMVNLFGKADSDPEDVDDPMGGADRV